MILITGATGFIGHSVTQRLRQTQQEWLAYDGRINNPQHLRKALEGIHTVIHLVGSEARGRTRLLQHVDVEGTERLIEESRRAQVQRLIIVSRIGADPNSLHPLLRTKGEVERAVRQSGIPYTIIRAATLFGRGDRFTELIFGLALWSWPLVWLPDGGQLAMQPLWIEDLARCIAAAVTRDDLLDKTITLAGEERLHYRDIVQILLQTTGVRRFPLKMPLVLLRPLTALIFSWWYWPAVSSFFADRFFVPEVAELDSILHYFGFRPARFVDNVAYLNRPGLRWRLFRH
ncbi:MAG: NAD(P)H-binding protein [Ardenticatenaceae bacterium]|nr:NAD(P)H-binding protein [Anaerolineales bacterium]MCB8923254.1 NAD(P)H-binding protein [Ardenticatenaceae bacterium]MCB9004801.1 NAD(P)H-binding protein [Ardenticatenaceae bacterium]